MREVVGILEGFALFHFKDWARIGNTLVLLR
jgi:hypothetical protein